MDIIAWTQLYTIIRVNISFKITKWKQNLEIECVSSSCRNLSIRRKSVEPKWLNVNLGTNYSVYKIIGLGTWLTTKPTTKGSSELW